MKKPGKIKCCSNCSNGIRINLTSDILCRMNGAVTFDYLCSKYKAKPFPEPDTARKEKCADCEFFTLAEDEDCEEDNIGLCKLFTVRRFNGLEKSACSKYSKKQEKAISRS